MEEYALHCAAKNGDLEQVKHFINLGQSVDSLDNSSRTPLHWAAKFGHVEIAEYLLQNNCDCNLSVNGGSPAALIAAERGHRKIVDLLLQYGAEVNNCSKYSKWTILHHACRRGWTETVQSIVKGNKAKLDLQTCVGATPLILATEEGHAHIAQILIQAGAQVNLCDVDEWTALHYASKRGWLPIVKVLVESGKCDVQVKNASGNTPLHIAYSMNNTEIMEVLLKAGADSNCRNRKNMTAFFGFPMHNAAAKGDLEEVKHLVELGVSVDQRDEFDSSPLHWAAQCNIFDIAEYLVHSGCNLNLKDRSGSTPLHWAAMYGNSAVAECLVRSSCNLNIKDWKGHTPIAHTLKHGNKAEFDLLYRSGAQFSCPDFRVLHRAIELGWLDTVQSLVKSGKWDINAAASSGMTPLLVAAAFGKADIAAFLIEAGADVTCVDARCNAALHWATFGNSVELVQALLKTGKSNINSKNVDGDTPLLMACFHDLNMVKMLLKAGADVNIKNKYTSNALEVGLGHDLLQVEGIRLCVQHGAFFEDGSYVDLYEREHLKNILKDVDICTQSIVNKFNNKSLPSLYAIPHFAEKLPSIDKFTLNSQQVEDIKKCVASEIKAYTFCNVVDARPNVLSILCVQSLLSYQSTM